MTDEAFVLGVVVEILFWEIQEDIRVELLEFTKNPISISNKSYSDTVNEHILMNNLEPKDIPS